MRYKSKIVEGKQGSRRYRGYKVRTGISGRRYRINEIAYTPNGIFHGEIFYEDQRSHTGDWGNGLETKIVDTIHVVVTISGNTDRALIERRTKLLLDAMNEEDLEGQILSADADEGSYDHFNRYIAGDR